MYCVWSRSDLFEIQVASYSFMRWHLTLSSELGIIHLFLLVCILIQLTSVYFIFQNQRISISKQSTVIGWQVLFSLFLNLNPVVLLAEAFCSPFTFVHGIEVDFGVLHWMHGGVSAQLNVTSVKDRRGMQTSRTKFEFFAVAAWINFTLWVNWL